MKTSWVKPSPTTDNALPDEWKEYEDIEPNTGEVKTFYYNSETKETTWIRPECDSINEDVNYTLDVEREKITENMLSNNSWVEKIDEVSGERYYFNTLTNLTKTQNPCKQRQTVTSEKVKMLFVFYLLADLIN